MTKAERIRILREDRGISQVELAERIGVSKQNMYKYENDIITNIPSDKIESMAKVLNVSPGYIMGWEDDKDKISDISATNANESMIGNRLKQLRENKGYNMRQMAAALNLPYTTYVNYEKGEREPNSEQLILFSKYFDVSIDYIIGIKNDIKSCELPNIKEFNIEERTKSTLADRLKQIMRERNIKQFDILEACKPYCKKYGVKLEKNDLSQYISGKVTPGQDKLTILGLALDVNEVWLMGYNIPHGRKDLDLIEEKIRDGNCCQLLDKCHNTEIYTAVEMLIKLDTFDLGRIIGNIETMLKAEKYTEKNQQVTTIYRAARSDDSHPPEIVETEKDFSKIPTTKNSKL